MLKGELCRTHECTPDGGDDDDNDNDNDRDDDDDNDDDDDDDNGQAASSSWYSQVCPPCVAP